MEVSGLQQTNTMNKVKLANGIMYISVALLFIFTAALSLSRDLVRKDKQI